MSQKKQELIQQIKQKYQEQFGASPEVINLLNNELNGLIDKPKISFQDLQIIESRINTSLNDVKQPAKIPGINQTRILLKPIENPKIETTIKDDQFIINKEINDHGSRKSFDHKNSILFGKAINSDMNGYGTYIRKDVMSSMQLTPIQNNGIEHGNLSINSSKIINKTSTLLNFQTKSIKSRLLDESKLKSLTPELIRSPEQKKNLWKQFQEREQEHHKYETEINNKRKLQTKALSEFLTKQIELQDKLKNNNFNNERELEEKILEVDMNNQKEDLKKKKMLALKMRQIEKMNMDNARKTKYNQDCKALMAIKSEYQQRLENDYKYQQELQQLEKRKNEQKALMKEIQQKAIKDRYDMANHIHHQNKFEDKKMIENLIKNQVDAELKVTQFYDNIRTKEKKKFEKLTQYFSVSPNRYIIKKNAPNEKSNTSLLMPSDLINPEKKQRMEKSVKDIQVKQQEIALQKTKQYNDHIDEQNALWKLEEDKMQSRENFLKEMEKIKKSHLKQGLDYQITHKNFLTNEAGYKDKDKDNLGNSLVFTETVRKIF